MVRTSSKRIKTYFSTLDKKIKKAYSVAEEARKQGLDPEKEISIPLAKNMAERVVGLISVVAPQIVGSEVTKRIGELEKEYGLLDWRVGFTIAEEVAKEKFFSCADKKESIEVGIRVGFAYLTLGIVSAPLEGFIGLDFKKRQDGKEYFAIRYAGPIRGAGGTAASTSVILADYVRVKLGYATYDPTEKEINRYTAEVHDYHDRVTNLQYHPSDEELKFMVGHLPIEVDGDSTERFEVSNYKDIPRIPTNLIRGGMALVLAEGLCQKAPKLWKRLGKWGEELGLGHWAFLQDFLKLKEEIHAAHAGPKKEKKDETTLTVKPNNTFIMDLVAGRPILTHPLGVGGFRLRYGRGRTSGFSAAAAHPATLIILHKYIAIGTQLKMERPGKATTITLCDTIEGPIVRLNNGSMLQLNTEEEAKRNFVNIEEIVFLGDILFNYGDFSENGHRLVPAGYCPEWWALELESEINKKLENINDLDNQNKQSSHKDLEITPDRLKELIDNPLYSFPTWEENQLLSKISIPFHPIYTFYWKLISGEKLNTLVGWCKEGRLKKDEKGITKFIFPYYKDQESHCKGKRILEELGVSHQVISKENIVLEKREAQVLSFSFGINSQEELLQLTLADNLLDKDALEIVNLLSGATIRDKAGTFIGARMGRPEKAKMRHLTGSPQSMFPVGEEGGRLRSFQSALKEGKVRTSFPLFYCSPCKKEMIYSRCAECGNDCEQRYYCRFCGDLDKETCRHGDALKYKTQEIDINYYFNKAKEHLGEKLHPDLIKGIRGTSNRDHVVEHLAKGVLRAKHRIYVNKDGTTRYDCTELPLTHFKPKEIHTSIEALHKLGYKEDIYGKELVDDNQILELMPQDIVLPGFDSLEESAPKVLTRVAQFVDELLVKFYKSKKFYRIKEPSDLVGHLVIGLAPHISAGTVGRIIGYSENQGLLAHPMFHAGLRRDCFDKDTFIPLKTKNGWEIEKIGEVVEKFNPKDIIDNFGTTEVKVHGIKSTCGSKMVKVKNFTKHTPQPFIKIKTKLGRTLKVTSNHKQIVFAGKEKTIKKANQLKIGDVFGIPYNIDIISNNLQEINLLQKMKNCEWVMVRGLNNKLKKTKSYAKEHFSRRDYDNFTRRDSYPIKFVINLLEKNILKKTDGLYLAAKRDTIRIPSKIKITKEFLQIVGLYIAEGYSREVDGRLYQMYIAAENTEIRSFVQKTMYSIFGLKITENKKDRLTYSSRIIYYLFTQILKCGSSAYEKRFPPCFLDLPLEKVGHILTGYFEGDGSVSKSELRVIFDTVSKGLLRDLDFIFARMGVFVKNYHYISLPGPKVREFYERKGRDTPKFGITKGTIQSVFVNKFAKYVDFISERKKNILRHLVNEKKAARINQKYDGMYVYDTIISLESCESAVSYCLNIEGNEVIANSILTKQCDGDEAAVMLLVDALLNFSRRFLPKTRGATMDSPLVLTSFLDPAEVDDQVHGMDVVWKYPLEFYKATLAMKQPWEVKTADGKKIEQLGDRLGTEQQYEGIGFTHHVDNFNRGVQCSAYKTAPSMQEKLMGQMEIAKKVRAVDMDDVAKLVIQKHFMKDIKGNLRKFSMQKFRCVKCNEKYRRPPLSGICTKCNGKLIFTISHGSVIKYLGPSLLLAEKYDFSPYLKETLQIVESHIDTIFGREKDKQVGLGEFIG